MYYFFFTKSLLSLPNITFYFLLLYITHVIPIDLTHTKNCLPFDDPKITNSWILITIVRNNITFAFFTLLIVKLCTKTPLIIQHADVQAQVYVRAKAK